MAKGETYEQFVEKFKPKKTTDDCYTPPLVYEAVKGWACREYGIDPARVVRPFWPGGDYERFEYPEGCAVIDNPPFSILSAICAFYIDRDVPFLLFAPSLTCLGGAGACMRIAALDMQRDQGKAIFGGGLLLGERAAAERAAAERWALSARERAVVAGLRG